MAQDSKSQIINNGYYMTYVGKDHHLADIRGYAYVHRLEAEKKISRRLLPGEEVHHIDKNKLNNYPDNLDIKKSKAHHAFEHRTNTTKKLKHPDEDNIMIQCFCGCGTKLMKYDEQNRERLYVSGHNPPKAELQDKILKLLSSGEKTLSYLSENLDHEYGIIKTVLGVMIKSKKIIRIKRATYKIYGHNKN